MKLISFIRIVASVSFILSGYGCMMEVEEVNRTDMEEGSLMNAEDAPPEPAPQMHVCQCSPAMCDGEFGLDTDGDGEHDSCLAPGGDNSGCITCHGTALMKTRG